MTNAKELLRSASVKVSPETFALVGMSREQMLSLLSDPSLSPRMTAPFMILMDEHEVTMVLDDVDLANMSPGLRDVRIERGYRLLTFDIVLEFSIVGFMAEVSRILADAGVPILAVSAYSRDHLLIRQEHLAAALKALGPHVAELC